MKKTKKGFTLVELLLVIAIIGILAAVLFVSLGKQRERARLTTFKENLRGLVTAATACRDGSGTLNVEFGSPVCTPALDIGSIPDIQDCDGSGDNIALAVADGDNDSWMYTGECVMTGGTCYALCNVNGCQYCNDALGTTCGSDATNCQ